MYTMPDIVRCALSAVALLLLLLCPAAKHHLAAAAVTGVQSSNGVRASLIHTSDFLRLRHLVDDAPDEIIPKARASPAVYPYDINASVRRSLLRSERYRRGRGLAGKRVSTLVQEDVSPSPSGGPVDWETPMSDLSASEYIMQITLGTPPRTFNLIADTGSDLVWLQCLPCEACIAQPDPVFDPSTSSSYGLVSCASDTCQFLALTGGICYYDPVAADGTECEYSYGYGGGNLVTGTLAQDVISLEPLAGKAVQKIPSFQFGCNHNITNTVGFDHTDGLVGLGQGDISFPAQLGQYFGKVFSYCLVNKLNFSTEVQWSPMVFGDAGVPSGTNKLQYTPILTDIPIGASVSYYFVDLEDVLVNSIPVPIPAGTFDILYDGTGGMFVDSGTTFTMLMDAAFDPLLLAISSAVKGYKKTKISELKNLELCYTSSWDAWASDTSLPRVSFKFAEASSFDLGAASTWLPAEENVICLAILRNSDHNVFGNFQQTDKLMVYDLEESRIGFVPKVCESASSTTPRLDQPQSQNQAPPKSNIRTLLLALLVIHFAATSIAVSRA